METLEQALERTERDLFSELEKIATPKVKALLSDFKLLKGANEILLRQHSGVVLAIDLNPTPTNGHGSAVTMTQGDAAYDVLSKAGQPLHISKILAEMPKYGITTATKINLNSILVKDRRERFINKGQATFALNPRPRESGKPKQQPLLGLPQGFSLTESIKALLPELKSTEFGQPDIFVLLRQRHPEAADRIQKASISTTLSKLVERNLIEVTHRGHGSEPRRYRTL